MGIFRKRPEVIEARRDAKRRVVEVIMQCVESGPHGLIGNAVLDDHEIGEVTQIVVEFVRSLTPADIDTLKTAKGCTRRPPESIERHDNTLYEFMRLRTTGEVQDAGCMHGFVYDLSKWAKQVCMQNPNSAINWHQCEQRMLNALDGAKLSKKQYFTNPAVRMPKDPEETLWYLCQAAYTLEDEQNGKGKWNVYREKLDRVLLANPNIKLLTWEKALKLGNKWYLDGEIPDEAR